MEENLKDFSELLEEFSNYTPSILDLRDFSFGMSLVLQ